MHPVRIGRYASKRGRRALRTLLIAGALVAGAGPVSAQVPDPPASVVGLPVAEPTAPPAPAFGGLFKKTPSDFRGFLTAETATILMLGGVSAFAGHRADRAVSAAMSGSGQARQLFGPGRYVGGPYFQMGGAFAAYALGRAAGNRRLATVGADLVRANLVTQALTQTIKVSTHRSRPDGSAFSFPSGHTSTTFAAATVVQRHFGWEAGVPAYAVATYVGLSRIQQKRHHLSDVAFGAALGIAAGRTVTLGVGRHRLSMSPVAVPGGAGISFNVR